MKTPKVLHKNILVKKTEVKEVKKNGLYIPNSAQANQRQFEVEAIGPDVKGVVVGDTVIVSGYGGMELTIDEVVYIIFDVDSIIVVLQKE